MTFRIDWSGRAINYTDEEIQTLVDVSKHADPLTQGKYLKQFEDRMKSYLDVEHAFGVTSAASALELIAVLSLIGAGDEVIIPSHTYCASAIPFGRTGAKLIWADIDSDTFVVSSKDIRKKITPKTKMLVVVHLYGLACDMDEIVQICNENNLILVEDCAQAIGAEYNGKKVGAFGDFACFSFHAQKNITTLGEGGILIVKEKETAQYVPGLRHNGHVSYGEREHYWIPAMGNVDLDIENVWPFNYSLSEIQAAIGVKLINRLDKLNSKRRLRARHFISELSTYPELKFQKCTDDLQSVFHLLPAKYDGSSNEKTNNDFIELMSSKYQVKIIVQYHPLNRYPLFVKMGFSNAECPNTDIFFDNMVSFPFHEWMSDEDYQYMIDSTKNALNELRG